MKRYLGCIKMDYAGTGDGIDDGWLDTIMSANCHGVQVKKLNDVAIVCFGSLQALDGFLGAYCGDLGDRDHNMGYVTVVGVYDETGPDSRLFGDLALIEDFIPGLKLPDDDHPAWARNGQPSFGPAKDPFSDA